jgi:ABC-type transport system involved in cytochrome c biogenesis permease component
MLTTPYLVFAALCVITFGVAFASIGNLGILTRQRSLVLPLLLVFWCLPPIVFASERARAELDARTDARVRAADEAAGRRPAALRSSAGR